MNVHIRYALGHSTHGDFIAAMSEQGLAAVEFPVRADNAMECLLARFPDAVLEEDETGLAAMVATLARVVDGAAVSEAHDKKAADAAPAMGIIASSNRLVRANGSIAGGRACAASVRAASHRVLQGIPRSA